MAKPIFAGILGGIAQSLQWADDANCKNMDLDLFFPDVGANVSGFVKEVCASCDVYDECLWYANETFSEDGVFAGMSPRARQHWRVQNGVELGMSKAAWRKSKQQNLLLVSRDDWNDGE